jgi:hypothetical protein
LSQKSLFDDDFGDLSDEEVKDKKTDQNGNMISQDDGKKKDCMLQDDDKNKDCMLQDDGKNKDYLSQDDKM